MGNQELFDKYIKGLLSETEKSDFESRLNTDKTLSSEFKTYLFDVGLAASIGSATSLIIIGLYWSVVRKKQDTKVHKRKIIVTKNRTK